MVYRVCSFEHDDGRRRDERERQAHDKHEQRSRMLVVCASILSGCCVRQLDL